MSEHSNLLDKKRPYIFKQFNWRALLVRILVNALTLIITVTVTPTMGFVAPTIWKIVLLAIALGLINALVKPIIQFLTLSYIFATYGLVVVFINTIILYLLSWLLPGYFHVDNILWALLGGAIMGVVAGFLESLFGLTLPIVDEESISEPMRKAAEQNERKFPFAEAPEQELDQQPPILVRTETAIIEPPAPEKITEPVPAALAEPPRQSDAPETPVIEETGAVGAETAAGGPDEAIGADKAEAPEPAAEQNALPPKAETPPPDDASEIADEVEQGGAA